jgi:hypothetical protein
MVADMERTVGFYTILLGVQANDEARNWPYFRVQVRPRVT